MKLLIAISILLFYFCSFGQVPDSTWKIDSSYCYGKCDSLSHDYRWISLIYPPCYECFCGKHWTWDMKTFMALEIKYGDSVDMEVRKYMKSGLWAKGVKILDSATVEKLAGAKYEKMQKEYGQMLKQSNIIRPKVQ